MPLEAYFTGRNHDVLVYTKPDGGCQVKAFLEGLDELSRKKVIARVAWAKDNGPQKNREQNKPVEGTKFFEFKTHGHRLFWRWSRSNQIILMYGFAKDGDISKRDLDAGLQIYGAIDDELKKGT